jgi:3-methyladenine DNA glycosylase AlkD
LFVNGHPDQPVADVVAGDDPEDSGQKAISYRTALVHRGRPPAGSLADPPLITADVGDQVWLRAVCAGPGVGGRERGRSRDPDRRLPVAHRAGSVDDATSTRVASSTVDPSGSAFVDAVRGELAKAGDPERAVAQQAYMKSEMPYRGITSPELKALLRPVLSGFRPTSRSEWEGVVRTLWDGATHREDRYAAIALARVRVARQWCDPAALPLFLHLVLTGAWWDYVDVIAAHLVGEALSRHRVDVTPVMRDWAVHDDLWVRRTAVLSQLRHREMTDRELLHDVIEVNVTDPSFWLRKAIGWALREFAGTDPEWVRAEVSRLGPRISGLSKREALKHL